ncbi:pilus assembly protein TadG-related protein [Janibacter sp. DB-40]|uniref:pilus assembly protein TadG-related protein n=1 Tax=Janibacter sp. DB-40 TaxID=3028808 RepID=UPI002406BAD0|nr:pilus assembly protein TadG-related protein [Janibacter sp. DB-40]
MTPLRDLARRLSGLLPLVRTRLRDDRGQLTVLVLGLTVIAMTVIIGGLAVTSVQVSRMRLLDAADAAALAATDEGAEQIYESGLGRSLPLTDESVRGVAVEHLAGRERPHGLESWSVAGGTGTPDGRTVVVRLTGEADLPMVGGLIASLGGSVTVGVESRARADVLVDAP